MRNADQVVAFHSNRGSQESVLAVAPLLAGPSPAATQIRAQVRRIAPYFHLASLTGSPCCGEEQVARALHRGSPYRDRPFVALSAERAEERFATNKLQPVVDGFLYLSDAEHLSATAQTGLLRLLRERAGRPVRLVAYTGRGLRPLLSAGLFNAELANLLGALSITVPPLQERRADLGLLFQATMKQVLQGNVMPAPYPSDGFLQAVASFHWPGNLEQMRTVAAWLVESRTGTLQPCDLSAALDASQRTTPQDDQQVRLVRLDAVVQEHIRSVLLACNGNKLRAAEVLGISRSTLYRMLDTVTNFNPFQLAG